MGKRDGSMMLQEMKTKRNNYQLFQLLLVADSTSEGKKNARSREQSFFLLFIFKCLAKKQTSKTHTHTQNENKYCRS